MTIVISLSNLIIFALNYPFIALFVVIHIILSCTSQIPTAFNWCGGYRSPLVWKESTASRMSVSSSFVKTISRDAQFSSRRAMLLVPGMGMISSPCAATQAKASCAGVTPFLSAIVVSLLTIYAKDE